jgi:hypothetical protein
MLDRYFTFLETPALEPESERLRVNGGRTTGCPTHVLMGSAGDVAGPITP